jgi:hypothetical protein
VGAADSRRRRLRWPHLVAPTAPIDERDIAAVAVHALCGDGHDGAEYVLTGPQSLSQIEQISTIGRVIGRSLRIEEMSPDEARRECLPVMPASVVNMLLAGTDVPRLGDRSRCGVSGVIFEIGHAHIWSRVRQGWPRYSLCGMNSSWYSPLANARGSDQSRAR